MVRRALGSKRPGEAVPVGTQHKLAKKSRESVNDKLSKLSQNCVTATRPANGKHSNATETRSTRSKGGKELLQNNVLSDSEVPQPTPGNMLRGIRQKLVVSGASRKGGKTVRTPLSRTNITREVADTHGSSDTDERVQSVDKVPRAGIRSRMVRRKSIIYGASRKRGTKVRTPPSRSNITREVDNTSESSDTDKSNRSEDKVPRTRVKVVRRSQVVGSQNKRKQKAALAAKKGLTRRTKNSHHISKSSDVSSSSSEESDQNNTSTVQAGSAPLLRIPTYETDSESEDMDPLIQQHANEDDNTDLLSNAARAHINVITGGQPKQNAIQSPLFAEPISVPISSQIPSKIKRKIWSNKYVDFAALLPNYSTQPKQQKFTLQSGNDSTFNLVPQSQTRKITHIAQWTSAFIRFVAVYSEKFP